ncbi:tail fiber protein [Jejuia spongiicola]|uniref:Tail fiber protein n=1 Tax=Jejuia spongiicola TaxID=2942207 RepID=A0ABT0QCW6_9FLAO|nr:tail fiber protein [Jejuia spongiicola]MCL6294841.1 tail fiber protein [Jejuia spongiicola]
MKKILIIFILSLFTVTQLNAQTNTFPTSGNVGIGTTTPAYELTVNGTTYSTYFKAKSLVYETFHSSYPDGVQKSHINQWNRLSLGLLTTGNYFSIEDWTAGSSGIKYLFSAKLNGNIGLGTLTPLSRLHLYKGDSGGVPHSYSDITIEDNDNGMISILTPSNKYGYFGFADENDDYVGGMEYYHGTNKLTFRVNNHASDMTIDSGGNVGIGTTSPDAKLAVKGNIHTNEVKVDLLGAVAPDYVFYKDYDLKTLTEVENYITKEGHLPNIPSAKEMEVNGLLLKEMNLKLLEKIEELILYTIQQEKEIKTSKNETTALKSEVENQKIINKNLEQRLQKIEALLNSIKQ